jgi:hypothetical protein
VDGGPFGRTILTSSTEEGKAQEMTRPWPVMASRAGTSGDVVGGEGGAAAGAVAAHDQQGVGVAADQDLGREHAGQSVAAEQRRPALLDAAQDRVAGLDDGGCTPLGRSARSSCGLMVTGSAVSTRVSC